MTNHTTLIYNRVSEHLIRQNAKSMDAESWHCRYRGEDNFKCAVGCCIDDAHYDPNLEGYPIIDRNVRLAVERSLGIQLSEKDLLLLSQLQMIHDYVPVKNWGNVLHLTWKAFNES